MNLSKLSTLFTLVLSATLSYAQTVRIADNNSNAPTGDFIYSTLQAAANAADAGDIIYIQPSPTPYGNLTVNKELHIKGIGFNLDKDLPHLSKMGLMYLWNNTDNTSNASNSTVTGIQLTYMRLGHGTGGTYTLDNVKINNCIVTGNSIYGITSDVFGGGTSVAVSNMEVYDCDMQAGFYFQSVVTDLLLRNNLLRGNIELQSTSASQSAIITNNIIYGSIRKESVGDALIIQHNSFLGANGSHYAFLTQMMDATIANNIFYGRTPSLSAGGASSSTNFQRNIFTNNLSYETGNDELVPSGGGVGNTGDGNIVASSPLFVSAAVVNSWSSARDFTLGGGSPALLGGSDGTDIGISGGISFPFTDANFLYKTTPIPTIQIFNTDAIINPGDNLDIRIKIKAN